jgi:hypothetical protein
MEEAVKMGYQGAARRPLIRLISPHRFTAWRKLVG